MRCNQKFCLSAHKKQKLFKSGHCLIQGHLLVYLWSTSSASKPESGASGEEHDHQHAHYSLRLVRLKMCNSLKHLREDIKCK